MPLNFMKKVFVLDTNVLLHDPRAIFRFDDNDIVIPMVVLEELDRIKVGADEVARNARNAIKELDRLRTHGSLSNGVTLAPGKGVLKIELNHQDLEALPAYLDTKNNDNRILSVAVGTRRAAWMGTEGSEVPVILVTRDVNLRVKADALKIPAEDYRAGKVDAGPLTDTFFELSVEKSLSKAPEREGWFQVIAPDGNVTADVPVNSFIRRPSDICRINKAGLLNTIGLVTSWGITPRNPYQVCAANLLLDNSISLVALTGIAGSGKTLISISCALRMVVESRRYKRLLVAKPVVPMGRDIGYIPGTVEEKMAPWMRSLYDTVDYLVSLDVVKNKHYTVEKLKEKDFLRIEPLVYIRGRSLPSQLILVDEAQNMTVHEMRTLITRAGEGTKVVLLGDLHQIDTPYLDAESNGLAYAINRFKGKELFGHIHLPAGERSALAEAASNLL